MNDEKRMKITKMLVVSGVILLVLLLTALIVNLIKLGSVNARRRALEAELARLDAAIAENDEAIAYRKTDAYIDATAREYLDMIGKDEEAFIGK